MNDSDVNRLEDRIEAVNREGQLRLDGAMARIEGAIGRIIEQTSAMRQEMQEQRADARALRTELQEQRADARALRTDLHADLAGQRTETKAQYQWIIGTIIGTALVVLFGIGTLIVGVKQVWISGVQVGQTIQATPAPPASSPPK